MIQWNESGNVSVEVIDEWRCVDRWWTASPVHREYVVVLWGERRVVMWRTDPDTVWRVWGAHV